ncbi:MAG: bifunctional UDP-sugar hydrolase/5'-nucleotidase [Bdellovibrionota bacterium]
MGGRVSRAPLFFTRLCIVLLLLGGIAQTQKADAALVPLTIMHTNDVHSHYRPDRGPFNLGGIARLSTAISRIRAQTRHSLLLDGGDWSEGYIYYNLGAGRTAIEMMNRLGYDAAVIGNHDWLNGPDQLIRIFEQVPPQFYVLAANIDTSKYPRWPEFSRYVTPYEIMNVGPLKVAMIGVVTYEFMYDKYFDPIRIEYPIGVVRKLSNELKKKADLVVVVSHNSMGVNKLIAGLPSVDVVIHAHDHYKFAEPIVVTNDHGKRSLIVEAGLWGFYLGRLDLMVDTKKKTYRLVNYELIQIDGTIPGDPKIESLVNHYDRQVVQKYGDIFQDHIAETTVDLRREHSESNYINLLVDAYRDAVPEADVSFEQFNLTSGEFYKGPIHTADVFNALAAVYNPLTDKAWTLRKMKMTGETLTWITNFVLSLASFVPGGLISASGLRAIYDPALAQEISVSANPKDRPRLLRSLEVGGKPIDEDREYVVVLPQGIAEAIEFIDKHWGDGEKIPRSEEVDTGIEDWRALANYMKKLSPINPAKLSRGGRITVLQSDLSVYHDEIEMSRKAGLFEFSVVVRNIGTTASGPRHLSVTYDLTPRYTGDDPNRSTPRERFPIPPLKAGEMKRVYAKLKVPEAIAHERLPIYFMLDPAKEDPLIENNGTWIIVEPTTGTLAPDINKLPGVPPPQNIEHSHEH